MTRLKLYGRFSRLAVASLVATSFFAACQVATMPGDDGQPPVNDNESGNDNQPDDGSPVSFSQDVQPIFDFFCINCHVANGIAERSGVALRLVADESYAGLVNQSSAFDDSLVFVVPGDSASSFLFDKISNDSPARGQRMPFLDSPLDDDSIALIGRWINEGAADN